MLEASPHDVIPEGTADSESSLLARKMVLIMILLKPMEPTSLVFGRIHKVEGVVADIIDHVADQEEGPVGRVQYGIVDDDDLLEADLDRHVVQHQEQGHGQHQSVSTIGNILRVVGKHVMNAVGEEVAVPHDPVVGQDIFGVEDEPVKNVLHEAEVEESSQGDQKECE